MDNNKDQFEDRGYKKLFSHPRMVEDLIKSFVKEDFVRYFDFSKLKLLNSSFVTEEFKKRESDIIWEVSIKGKPAYIYILIEFQSTVDKFMSIRILSYILLFYGMLLNDRKIRELPGLPSVFPILLYNGDDKWTAPLSIEELIDMPFAEMAPYMPRFRYYKIVENEFSAENLEELRNLVGGLFLIERSDMESIEETITKVIRIMRSCVDPALQREFGLWLRQTFKRREMDIDFDKPDLDERTVREMLETNLDRHEKKMRLEGEHKKGLEIARKMKEMSMDKETIIKITGLTETEIEKA